MKLLKLTIALLIVSQVFAAGADVSCTTSNCSSCTAVPTSPANLAWGTGNGANMCAITTCPASTASGLVGASDLFCKSCPGTANGSTPAIYSNTANTACVAATATCGNSRTANTWTNADCLACNGTSMQYAKSDKSSCQATFSNSLTFVSAILVFIYLLF